MVVVYECEELKAMMKEAVMYARANDYFDVCPYDHDDEVNAYLAGARAVYGVVRKFLGGHGTLVDDASQLLLKKSHERGDAE